MEFGDLPLELRLKIFSYLPQPTLLTIADVSSEWKDLAFDPLLWTEVNIYWSLGMADDIVQILERATSLKSLYISPSANEHLEFIAPALPRFRALHELMIHKDALALGVTKEALKNCPSLSAVVLLGELTLVDGEVAVLSTLRSLKSLFLHRDIRVPNEALQQISRGCPGLQMLEFNSDHISCCEALAALSRLQQLTWLSVTHLCKGHLPFVFVRCPHLEYLHIGALNQHRATETAKLGEFLGLRGPTVNTRYQDNPALTSLKCFDAPEMRLEERELQLLLRNCGQSLRHVAFNALKLAGSVLDVLSVCRSLKSMHIYGLSADNLCLDALLKFPKLVRASLDADASALGAVHQLPSMVDVFPHDASPLDGAWLILDVFCSSKTSRDAVMPEVCAFKDFIASNTRVPKAHIQDTERQGEGERQWACRTVTTWFPPAIKTLKRLELNLGRC